MATPHLELSLRQFTDLGKRTEADRARCAAGVSKGPSITVKTPIERICKLSLALQTLLPGQEVMDRYIDLILACGARDIKATLKICQWKNNRVPFWKSSKTNDNQVDEKTIAESQNAKGADILDNSVDSLHSPTPTTRSKSTIAESEIVQQTL